MNNDLNELKYTRFGGLAVSRTPIRPIRRSVTVKLIVQALIPDGTEKKINNGEAREWNKSAPIHYNVDIMRISAWGHRFFFGLGSSIFWEFLGVRSYFNLFKNLRLEFLGDRT